MAQGSGIVLARHPDRRALYDEQPADRSAALLADPPKPLLAATALGLRHQAGLSCKLTARAEQDRVRGRRRDRSSPMRLMRSLWGIPMRDIGVRRPSVRLRRSRMAF